MQSRAPDNLSQPGFFPSVTWGDNDSRGGGCCVDLLRLEDTSPRTQNSVGTYQTSRPPPSHCLPQDAHSVKTTVPYQGFVTYVQSACVSLGMNLCHILPAPGDPTLTGEVLSHVCLQKAFSSPSLALKPAEPAWVLTPQKPYSPYRRGEMTRQVGVGPERIERGNRKLKGRAMKCQ